MNAVGALAVGVLPGLPGFFMTAINKDLGTAGVKIFQINYFVGFPLGFLTYIALCHFFPPAGLGVRELMSEDVGEFEPVVIEGEGIEKIDEKGVVVNEKGKESDAGDSFRGGIVRMRLLATDDLT